MYENNFSFAAFLRDVRSKSRQKHERNVSWAENYRKHEKSPPRQDRLSDNPEKMFELFFLFSTLSLRLERTLVFLCIWQICWCLKCSNWYLKNISNEILYVSCHFFLPSFFSSCIFQHFERVALKEKYLHLRVHLSRFCLPLHGENLICFYFPFGGNFFSLEGRRLTSTICGCRLVFCLPGE